MSIDVIGDRSIRPEIANPLGSSESNQKIARLEKIIRYLLLKNFIGEPLAPGDRILREFLQIKEEHPTREAVIRRIGASDVLGTMICPSCGSGVRDVEGVTDERCPTCGEVVGSER